MTNVCSESIHMVSPEFGEVYGAMVGCRRCRVTLGQKAVVVDATLGGGCSDAAAAIAL
ncbi:MAG: hypothetical protein JJT88_00470 [Gammaproteobacteria bacterium]|nr:hypothetical protein [Gammaproteobacteria bacterium]